jgi:peptidoglycan/LPS O-acetylase OafA/YrhL
LTGSTDPLFTYPTGRFARVAVGGVRAFWSRLSLRRITTSGNYIAEIDGLRFVAIISLLFYHIGRMTEIYIHPYVAPQAKWQALFPDLVFHGARGVDLFFVISGFVLGLPFAEQYLAGSKKVKLRAYFLRRLTRLEPPYIINLLIRVPLVAMARHMTLAQIAPHLLASLGYLHVLTYGQLPIVHLPSWSLEVEVEFYILAPLFAYLLFRNKPLERRLLYSALLVGAGLLQWHSGMDLQLRRASLSILNFGQYFVAGFLFADLFVTVLPKMRESWMWDAISIPLWAVTFYLNNVAAHFWIPFIAPVLYVGAFKGRLLRGFFRNHVVSIIGGMCYSIYLTHSLVLQGCYYLLMKLSFLHGFYPHLIAGIVLITPIIVFVGAVFFVVVERPCMDKNWPRKLADYFREHGRIRFEGNPKQPAMGGVEQHSET